MSPAHDRHLHSRWAPPLSTGPVAVNAPSIRCACADSDTAGAAAYVKEQGDPHACALAPALAAELYGLELVEPQVEDAADNTTRFFVLGRQPSGSAGAGKDLTSLLVSLGDEAASHSGALLRMLMPLAERGINLSKIESRPSKRRPWDYYFFLDVTGHYEDPAMREAIAELRRF
jgi:chorismate mutase/prephenate dehydratase